MIALSGTFKRVDHAIKQRDKAFSPCTVRAKMLYGSAQMTVTRKG
jgi:hypothetical protein